MSSLVQPMRSVKRATAHKTQACTRHGEWRSEASVAANPRRNSRSEAPDIAMIGKATDCR
jgi:hypothetical protein